MQALTETLHVSTTHDSNTRARAQRSATTNPSARSSSAAAAAAVTSGPTGQQGPQTFTFHSCRNRQRSPYRQPLGALKFLQSLRL